MKERPILFSAPMVCAILEGRKTQTRRMINPHPPAGCRSIYRPFQQEPNNWQAVGLSDLMVWYGRCPYGMDGDSLWVRETWAQPTSLDPGPTLYLADYPDCVPSEFQNVPPASEITWKPSIHMRRIDSRINLKVTGVRVERLQDITEADAIAEGFIPSEAVSCDPEVHRDAARDWFNDLWCSINGVDSWTNNPWVWVIEFERIKP